MEEERSLVFTQNFPYIWEQKDLPETYKLSELLNGDDWDIINLPSIPYTCFLYSFQEVCTSDLDISKSFELFEYYKNKNGEEEQFFVIIQDNYYYIFDLRRMIDLYREDLDAVKETKAC